MKRYTNELGHMMTNMAAMPIYDNKSAAGTA